MNALLLSSGKIISTLFIFFIPGYLTTLFFKQKPSLSIFISLLFSSFGGLLLAQIGIFSLFHLVLPLAIYSLILSLSLYFKGSIREKLTIKWSRENWLLLAVMLGAIFLFFRPHQYLEGGWDPGTYLNTGINIAKTGSIKIKDATWEKLEAQEQELFSHTRAQLSQKYPGFPVIDSKAGLIIPRFYHLYPVWIAIFYSLFGLKISLYVNSFFAWLTLLIFYHSAKILFNRKIAFLATILLALSAIQIWYVRFSTSEILSQFFIWSGIGLLALYEEKNKPFLVFLGALALGATLFTSFTAILILPAIIIYFFYRNWEKFESLDLFFIVPFILFLFFLLFQTIFFTKDYVYNVYYYHYKYNPVRNKIIIGLVAGVLILILLKIFSRKTKPIFVRIGQKQYFRKIVAFGLLLLALYAYFLRPKVMVNNFNATNLKELALFLTPLGMGLAIFGLVSLFWLGFSQKKSFWIILALTFSFFFLGNKAINPNYPWGLRRYVPVILPSFYLFLSYSIFQISQWKKILGKVIAIIILGYLFVFPFWRGYPMIKQVDYQGMVEFSNKLAQQMLNEAIYICDGYWLATPLHFIYDKNTLSLSDLYIPKGWKVILVLEKWLKQGKVVFYLTHTEKPFTPRIDFQEVNSVIFQTSRLEQPLRQLPRKIKEINVLVKIFQLKLLDAQRPVQKNGKFFIDIGWNCLGLTGGFDQARNYQGGITARWTYEMAEIVIPWPEDKDSTVTLSLKIAGERPPEEKLARVSLYLDNNFIQEIEVSNEMKEYQLVLPASKTQSIFPHRSVLKLISTTWNPNKYGLQGYSSNLGVLLDWVKVEF